MTHVKLMGELGEKFGTDWNMDVSSFRDVFRLIDCQADGFKKYLTDCAEEGINFTIQNGEDLLEGTLDALIAPVKDTVIITPVAAGAGVKDALKIVAGALLIMYGPSFIKKFDIFAPGGTEIAHTSGIADAGALGSTVNETTTVASKLKLNKAGVAATKMVQAAGVSLGMEGVMGYLTPDTPSASGKSYLFDGPENNVKQGAPVPILYGQLMVGGSVMNYGLEEIGLTNHAQAGYTLVTDGSVTYSSSPRGGGTSGRGGKDYGQEAQR